MSAHSPTRPRRRGSPPRNDPQVTALAGEAVALAAGACSTRVGTQVLKETADRDPALLDAAADRCEQSLHLDERVRGIATQLLRGAAAEIRLAQRRPQRGTIRVGATGPPR